MKKYKYVKNFTWNGHRYKAYADTQAELAVKIGKKIAQLETERQVVSGSMTLSAWAEQCIATYKTNQTDETRKTFNRRIKACILDDIGYLHLKEIKPIHVQQCVNRQEGKSQTQINEVYYALKFLFRHAYQNRLIKEDPTDGLVKPKKKKSEKRRALTPYERKKVIEVGKTDRRYYLFLLMLFCGCRPAEAAECMGKDIVRKDDVWLLHIRGSKTSSADRLVPIPAELLELIKDTPRFEWIAQNRDGNQLKAQPRARAWASFKRQLNIAMGCKLYRNALVPPLPLAPDLVPYCLRHEYCTDLARRGVDIRTAQKLMGHSSIELTANIYTNLDDQDIINVAKELQGISQGISLKYTK